MGLKMPEFFLTEAHAVNLQRLLYITKRPNFSEFVWLYFDTGLVASLPVDQWDKLRQEMDGIRLGQKT